MCSGSIAVNTQGDPAEMGLESLCLEVGIDSATGFKVGKKR